MKKQLRVFQVDAFTREKFTGNPAGVVLNADGLTEKQMQQIAREMNLSETAFITEGKPGEYDIEVRYFTPAREVPLCGHATIGAHYARAKALGLENGTIVTCKTKAGILPVQILKENDDYRILMTGGKVEVYPLPDPAFRERICKAYRIKESDLRDDFPLAVSSMGHSKIIVPLKEEKVLHSLRPDFNELYAISDELQVWASYAFTYNADEDPQFHGRMFAPYLGVDEDPVTGNANGPVGAYMVYFGLVDNTKPTFNYRGVQGEAMGRRGTVEGIVTIEDQKPVKCQIIGEGVSVFETTIEVDIEE